MGSAIRQFVIAAVAVLAVTMQTATSAVESDVSVLQAPQISEQPSRRDDQSPHLKRLWWDISHIVTFSWRAYNPYMIDGEPKPDGSMGKKPVKRTAWQDVTHALKNLWQS
jgi:hypothetical protein